MADDQNRAPLIVTVDVVLFTIVDGCLKIALVKRQHEPFKGANALIGGYVRPDVDADPSEAAARILLDKAGLRNIFIEQLYTFGGASRDPRGWSLSIAYYALVPHSRLSTERDDLIFVDAEVPGALPFDHDEIVAAGLVRVRGKGAYSTLPARLLPPTFTMPELLNTYRIVTGARIDQSSFRRKILELDLLEPAVDPQRVLEKSRRPAAIFKLRDGMTEFGRKI